MRVKNVLRLLAFVLACLVTIVPSTVFAQTETGRVTGTVTDPNDLVVPGATVTLTSTTSGAVRSTVSDAVGRYVIPNVPPGTYILKVELSGFGPRSSNVAVGVGSTVALDTKLRIAGTAETVSVTAETPVVNVSNAEVSTTITQQQISDLPTITRDPYDLVAVAGNVTDTQDKEIAGAEASRGANGFTVNGQRASATNVLLDGAANNDEFRNGWPAGAARLGAGVQRHHQ